MRTGTLSVNSFAPMLHDSPGSTKTERAAAQNPLLPPGRLPDAVRTLERTVAQAPIPVYQAALGHAYAMAGRRADAEKTLRTLMDRARTDYISPYDIATIYAGLGDRSRTLDFLQQAFDGRAASLVYIRVDPRFDSYRSEPRYRR
jgi:predicted Zn-dependent protease